MEAPTDGTIRLPVVLRFVDLAADALAEAREEIDALNVYPVPDGDTGTNMYLTVSAARDALRDVVLADPSADLAAGLQAFRRGALLGARGNSGVILSEMLGAFAQRVGARGPGERNATVMAEAMTRASDASYAAVGEPVEGTILTVARAAAEAGAARARDADVRARD
ncbi:MAG: DAK2 domain-containing protein, partial [Nocardioides sp.]